MAMHDFVPRDVGLLGEEHIPLLQFGDNFRVSLDFLMVNAFSINCLDDLDQVRRRALEADGGIALLHVALELIELVASSHISSLGLPRVCVSAPAHTRAGRVRNLHNG
jgi:hypothetical protein